MPSRDTSSSPSAQDPLNSFTLVPNDVTHIIYEEGGFFKPHSDYLSVTSNCVEEYTMLVCVTPPDATPPTAGGATVLTLAPIDC